MKRKSKFILRILASTVSVVLLASAFPFPSSELTTADAAQTTTISNPIIWADVPDEDIIRWAFCARRKNNTRGSL